MCAATDHDVEARLARCGELCAFVCSAQASYIVGQNLLIDGGSYPGTF